MSCWNSASHWHAYICLVFIFVRTLDRASNWIDRNNTSAAMHLPELILSYQIFSWAVFTIYLATFSYLADWYFAWHPTTISDKAFLFSYGPFASSALAGQSLSRESEKHSIIFLLHEDARQYDVNNFATIHRPDVSYARLQMGKHSLRACCSHDAAYSICICSPRSWCNMF